MRKIAVLLSGCGVYDGSEIHEATMTMYAIARNSARYEVFAPDMEQYHVVNHLTGELMNEQRNVLIESARIARGAVKPLTDYEPEKFDALVIPGGFGAAKNLSSFAFDGVECIVQRDVVNAIKDTHSNGKPIGALCIAPVLLAKVLGNVTLTIGQDESTAEAIEAMGAHHERRTHTEVVIDKKNKIFTSPCYMLDANIVQIAEGADNLIKAILSSM